jgi:hypothetical protein
MNILSNLNLPVSPIKVPLSFTPTPNAVAGFSFKGLSVITSKSLNIDTATLTMTSSTTANITTIAMSAGLNSKDPFVTIAIGQSKLLTKMSKNTFGKGKKKD